MADAGKMGRPRPLRPYAPTEATLFVPAEAITATMLLLQAAGRREACTFWYGKREGTNSTVTAVRAPAQHSTPFNFHVDEVALSLMAATLADDLRPLVQVHSHPGHDVEHSRYDDVMIGSKRALSLVFPLYGQDVPIAVWHEQVGVHEWQESYWHLLPPSLARNRLIVTVGAVDVRDLR